MRQNTLSRAWKEKVDINKSFYYDSTIISSPHGFMISRDTDTESNANLSTINNES